ncbi:uncharacterized protein LOC133801758 [Humulus lupulus]|uniref:uncharacterized protein LOC133801758 n=1 Tax=Humulus lupulus TaxID=3486 RepID=UPI002B40DC8A|nr:uncharacterized protein LOC133801758 [Humulus lupulus]
MTVRAKALIAMIPEEKNVKTLITLENHRKVGFFPPTIVDVPDEDGPEPVNAIDSPGPIHVKEVPSLPVLAGQEGDEVGASIVHSLLASDDFDETMFEPKSYSEGSDMFSFVHTQQRSTPTEANPSVRAAKRVRVEAKSIMEVPPEVPPPTHLASSPVVVVEPSLPTPVPPIFTDMGA